VRSRQVFCLTKLADATRHNKFVATKDATTTHTIPIALIYKTELQNKANDLLVSYIEAMKGTQDHSEVDPSGRRNRVQSRRGFTTTLRSWLFLGVVAILATPAMAQIGETLCACSPAVFNMTLDFSLTCADANIDVSDGIVTTDCSITPFQGEVSSLVPVNVFSVDFLELDQAGEVLNQRSRFVDLDDGAMVSYESFSNNPELVNELTAPRTLIVSFIARNAASEPLFMQYLITYTNSCDAFPVLTEGDQIGFTRFVSRCGENMRRISLLCCNLTHLFLANLFVTDTSRRP
jgi:hypothetical protein